MDTLNFQAIVDQLKAFLQGLQLANLPLVENTGLAYLEATQKRMTDLAANAPELTTDEITQALADEKDIFISELKSFEEIGLSLSQDALNNAGTVFMGWINNIIPAP